MGRPPWPRVLVQTGSVHRVGHRLVRLRATPTFVGRTPCLHSVASRMRASAAHATGQLTKFARGLLKSLQFKRICPTQACTTPCATLYGFTCVPRRDARAPSVVTPMRRPCSLPDTPDANPERNTVAQLSLLCTYSRNPEIHAPETSHKPLSNRDLTTTRQAQLPPRGPPPAAVLSVA